MKKSTKKTFRNPSSNCYCILNRSQLTPRSVCSRIPDSKIRSLLKKNKPGKAASFPIRRSPFGIFCPVARQVDLSDFAYSTSAELSGLQICAANKSIFERCVLTLPIVVFEVFLFFFEEETNWTPVAMYELVRRAYFWTIKCRISKIRISC